MPLESPDKDFFDAAVGYTQLGMFFQANEQLENVDPSLTAPRARERRPAQAAQNQFLSQGEIPSGPRGGEMPTPPGIAGFARSGAQFWKSPL